MATYDGGFEPPKTVEELVERVAGMYHLAVRGLFWRTGKAPSELADDDESGDFAAGLRQALKCAGVPAEEIERIEGEAVAKARAEAGGEGVSP